MPRPSLKAERRAQILDAYEACVARYGVEGATLERTAETAGLARALIRHNVGNREDLLYALVDRFEADAMAQLRAVIANLPERDALSTLIECMFDPQYIDPQQVLVSEAFVIAAPQYPKLAEAMRRFMEAFLDAVADVIVSVRPAAQRRDADAVAAGLMAIYFNVESLHPLGALPRLTAASKHAALLLAQALPDAASTPLPAKRKRGAPPAKSPKRRD